LLLGLKEKHERVDDLESFFHVLNWVALQFVPNDLSAIDLGLFLYNWYDYAQPGNHKGGVMKRQAMGFRSLAKEVRFHPPALRKLVENLEDAFAALYTQYDEAAALAWLDRYNRMPEDQRESLAMLGFEVPSYVQTHRKQQDIKSPKWMIKQYDEALQSMKLMTAGNVVARCENTFTPHGTLAAPLTSKRKDPPTNETPASKKLRGDPRTRQETSTHTSQPLAAVAEEKSMTEEESMTHSD
jgi:hypothetical protein